jgi:ABC-type spermidine/putrescine transport system permease subunit I
MAPVLAVLAVTDNAPLDWALGAAASFLFVALIAVPAVVLNSRDRKRRAQSSSQEHSTAS